MKLTWAGWLFLLTAWGCIGGLTAFCMWKVLVTTQWHKRSPEEEAVIPTP